MRPFVSPGPYEDYLEGRIAEIVDEIRKDVHRREQGAEPLIPDQFINPGRSGMAFVLVGHSDDNVVDGVQQAKAKARSERRTA